jgi:hypothetical protein
MKKTRNHSWTLWARLPLIVLCAAVLMVGAAAAQRGPASLDDRIIGSERVVVARARTVDARWEENAHGDRLIVSRYLLEVTETLKGVPSEVMWLDVEGGTLGGLTLRVSSLPRLEPGDRAVFFLEARADGVFGPYLRGQGILRLDDQDMVRGTNLALADIRVRAFGLGQ